MKFSYIFLSLLSVFFFASCDEDTFVPFDHNAQSTIDDDALVTYMQTHYYDESEDQIKEVTAEDQRPFYLDAVSENVTYEDVSYKLYHIVSEQGVGYQPTVNDSILPTYRGELLDGYVFEEVKSIQTGSAWFSLAAVIPGWTYGFPHFKGGVNISQPEMPLEFENFGKGFLFIPSGLAYREVAQNDIPGSSPLVFKIELHYAKEVATE